jgi:hypothetical protein
VISADTPVAPPYPWLVRATAAERRALLEVAQAVGMRDGAALAAVITSESGGDPTAPHAATGLPRAGLIQITQGARLPGFDTAERIWAVRSWGIERQLRSVVLPYYARLAPLAPDTTAEQLYRLNFLPGDAHQPDDFRIGDASSESQWRRAVYAQNSGFDHEGKGFITWADVGATIRGVEARAPGPWVTVGTDPPSLLRLLAAAALVAVAVSFTD